MAQACSRTVDSVSASGTYQDTATTRPQWLRVDSAISKIAGVKGYNTPAFIAKNLTEGYKGFTVDRLIERWEHAYRDFTATGLLVRDGLLPIDIDTQDPAAIEWILDKIRELAPEVHDRAPMRGSTGSNKIMLFARLVEDAGGKEFSVWKSPRYLDADENEHKLELFGGKLTQRGNASKQVGVYGPHSHNEDGSVARTYEWREGPTLLDTALSDLPAITYMQCWNLKQAFVAYADAREDWRRDEKEAKREAGEGKARIYDIDETTEFWPEHSDDVLGYNDLADGMRCAATFSGPNRTKSKCLVHWSEVEQCHWVWDFGDEVGHWPKEKDTTAEDEELRGMLHDLREEATAAGIPEYAVEPNWRERYVSGRPKPSLHNARLAIGAIKVECSWDVFHNRMMLGRSAAAAPSAPLPPWCGAVSDVTVRALRVCLSDTFGFDLTEVYLRPAVESMCEEQAFDPVVDMLAEAEAGWDGVARLDRMAVDFLCCEDSEFAAAAVRKFMIAAVARARHPGCKFDTILTMESPEGWNKSTALRVLAGDDCFSDVRVIGRTEKEVMEQSGGVWIHEICELAGMTKAEVEDVKAFASRLVDKARPAYGRYAVEAPRRTVYAGTTNATRYLQSQTGNRRFWPVRITGRIDLSQLRKYRLQLWGEAAAAESTGERLELDERLWPAAGAEQEARRTIDPWESVLANMDEVFTGHMEGLGSQDNHVLYCDKGQQRVYSVDVLQKVLKIPSAQMHRGHFLRIQEIMARLGWQHKANINAAGRQGAGYERFVEWYPGVGKGD